MEPLTRKQQDVLNYIADATAAKGKAPVLREIASAFGLSIAGAFKYVRALKRKGHLDVTKHAHRGIRLTSDRRDWKVRGRWRGEFEERIGARLRGETDLLPIFDIVRGDLRTWLDVERAELLVADPNRRGFHDRSFFDVHPAGTAEGGPAAGTDPEDLVARASRRRRPVVESGAAAVPVTGRDRVLGVLRLADRRPNAPLDEAKLARAALAAAALAPALERAALVQLLRAVNSGDDFQRILRDIYAVITGLIDASYFVIAVRNDAGEWWVLMETDHADGQVYERLDPYPAPIDHEALLILRKHPWFILHRTPEEIRILEAKKPHATKSGWHPAGIVTKRSRSLLCTPLRSGGEQIGYISAQSYHYNAYSVQNAEDLILVGEYIGLALQSAWRREGLRKELEAARRELEELRRGPGS